MIFTLSDRYNYIHDEIQRTDTTTYTTKYKG